LRSSLIYTVNSKRNKITSEDKIVEKLEQKLKTEICSNLGQ